MIDFPARTERLTLSLGILCDHALIGQDGKLSLIGIFDHIGVSQLPAQHPRFFVVVVLQGSSHEQQVEMEFVAPDGRSLMREAIPIDPQAVAQGNGKLLAEINMLVLDQPGTFEFRVSGGGRQLGNIPLHVDHVQPDQQVTGPTPVPRA
ncbi:MAG TPA: hypothetical protein VN837_02435 [Chloroflexota bacterium]|nr:hypothetical protein [Chloroflexota bacterium]